MSKQDTLEYINSGMDTIGVGSDSAPSLFREHYQFALRSMTSSHAAAIAHDAVQRHLASLKETEAGD